MFSPSPPCSSLFHFLFLLHPFFLHLLLLLFLLRLCSLILLHLRLCLLLPLLCLLLFLLPYRLFLPLLLHLLFLLFLVLLFLRHWLLSPSSSFFSSSSYSIYFSLHNIACTLNFWHFSIAWFIHSKPVDGKAPNSIFLKCFCKISKVNFKFTRQSDGNRAYIINDTVKRSAHSHIRLPDYVSM